MDPKMRLFKVAMEFNVATHTIVEILGKSGFQVENKPNARITPEMYTIIKWTYGDDRDRYEESQEKRLLNKKLQNALLRYKIEESLEPTETNSKIQVWEPIEFNDTWIETDTSLLDDISPSWFTKRSELNEDTKEYVEFIERLKRQHAIETGIVEKLYDLNEGITQTFIKEGFLESLIQHGDSNIDTPDLMKFLKDHYAALDIIFDFVKEDRSLTKGFLFELHQLITSNQKYTTAIDQNGVLRNIPLLKGEFKKQENNPRRDDGSIYYYCPPVHVDLEIEKLISIYYELEKQDVKPVIISAWFHHAFTQIHPFQDGNGRMARLLATMIFIKHDYFPFTVKREEKLEYISALEKADKRQPNELVRFFCKVQKRNIEAALNVPIGLDLQFHSLQNIAENFATKINAWQNKQLQHKQRVIDENRDKIFGYIFEYAGIVLDQIKKGIQNSGSEVFLDSNLPDSTKYYWYNKQIADYATKYNYYFNKSLPRGWFKYSIKLPNNSSYDIVITIHHFGYGTETLAIGAFMEYYPPEYNNDKDADIIFSPFDLQPHTISLNDNPQKRKPNIGAYLSDIVTIGLTKIMNEFSS